MKTSWVVEPGGLRNDTDTAVAITDELGACTDCLADVARVLAVRAADAWAQSVGPEDAETLVSESISKSLDMLDSMGADEP